MSIASEIHKLQAELPEGVRLVAVSKFHPAEAVAEAYAAGQRLFGESRVQELLQKIPLCPSDIQWHFIGHLQTNKVRQLMGKTALIESVDSERLLELIDSESARAGVVTRVLMQVHVAREETKFGFWPDELLEYFRARKFETLKATHICGVMAIADVFRAIRDDSALALRGFDMLSMGMSGDWPVAVEEGASLVRVGTRIFGPRQY